jgi:hypothetical protein
MAAVSQGDLGAALGLNPFVLFAWPLLFSLALLAFAPGPVRARVEAALDRHGAGLTRGYLVVLAAFLGFGLLRFALMAALGEPFP